MVGSRISTLIQIKRGRSALILIKAMSAHMVQKVCDKWSLGELIRMLHKRVLEWQAEHPTITWIGWGIVWAIVLTMLFWPTPSR